MLPGGEVACKIWGIIRFRFLAGALALLLLIAVAWPAQAATNDPLFDQQWGLRRIGADAAWKVSRGAGVLIAIIDTGVDLEHPDLAGKVVPGLSLAGGGPPDDTHGHGTLIAGIAAASTGNGEGIASVAPDAGILPVRVFDQGGSATSSRVARAIRFAVDAAAARRSRLVLNLSFVGPSQALSLPGSEPANPIFGNEAVKRAIADAAGSGAVVVTAAGNEGVAQTAFNAPRGRGIITVGASDQKDGCAPFTNYGPGLDILAPGTDIVSTYWNRAQNRSGYAFADGTSMAVPFVSGAAALLLATGLSNVQAVDRILTTASGPGVSCRGEQTRYKVLDVAAALGVPRDAGEEPPASTKPNPSPVPSALLFPAAQQAPVEVQPHPGAGLNRNGQLTALMRLTPLRAAALAMLLLVLSAMVLIPRPSQPQASDTDSHE